MPKETPKRELTKKQAQKILWNKGVLRWKLKPNQKKVYDAFHSGKDDITTMMIARQSGKSYTMCVIGTEVCLRQPNSIVKYVCPKKKMVKTILKPIMREIFADCPDHLKPEYKEADKIYIFPNGSEIQMAGTDNQNYDDIRGGKAHLWIVDEAGFCKDLEEVVYSVLKPTTTTTNGKGILASTPDPKEPEHPFIKLFVEPAEALGKLFKATIYENTLIDDVERQKIINSYPDGVKNPRFRAEFLCEIVRDAETLVIPEFDDETEKAIVKPWKRPPFFDIYLSMDIGGKDFTVVLFAYHDFLKNKVIIEDEFVLKGKQNSGKIAEAIKKQCNDLWGEKPPYLMFADNNNVILLNDLQLYHKINFIPTKKDNKEAAINHVRLKIQNHDIIIHPRCTTLIYHLKRATWAKSQRIGSSYKQFSRSADDGHFDAVDAIIYLIRNIVYSKNPYPSHYGLLSPANSHIRNKPESDGHALANILKVKSSLKN